MPDRNNITILTEVLTVKIYISSVLYKNKIFYKEYSFIMQIFLKLFPSLFNNFNIKKLEIGHICDASNVRKNAYWKAEKSLKYFDKNQRWLTEIEKYLKFNTEIIFEKLVFETNYNRFQFYELCIQYTKENKNSIIVNLMDKNVFFSERNINSCQNEKFNFNQNTSIAYFIQNFLKMIVITIYFLFFKVSFIKNNFNSTFVCNLGSISGFKLMKETFKNFYELNFIVEKKYLKEFDFNFLKKNKIMSYKLYYLDYLKIFNAFMIIIKYSFLDSATFKDKYLFPYRFYKLLFEGFEITPTSKKIKYLFVTGHLNLERSLRNEILKKRNCKSVYLSANSYVTYQEFPNERQINYDIFCSSGMHAEDLYRKKNNITKNFVVTGSFNANYDFKKQVNFQKNLKNIKKNNICVVVLSPGICEETLSHEKKLVEITKSISDIKNVEVFFRRKPVEEDLKYKNFYKNSFSNYQNIHITSNEINLNEFLDIGDIFITSISSSAMDLLSRGAKVYFIDFMKTPTLYLPWEKFPKLVLNEKNAFKVIKSWIKNENADNLRKIHYYECLKMRKYVGEINNNFKKYKSSIIKALK